MGSLSHADAEEIARALGGRRSGRGWIARCPAHEDRRPSLSIADGADGRLLLHCFAGCVFDAVVRALDARGFVAGRDAISEPRGTRSRQTACPEVDAKRACAAGIWSRGRSAAGTPVEGYLRSRGVLVPPPAALRFAPRLKHSPGASAPAMLAAIRDREGRFAAVHRTWLAWDGRGKADFDPPRKMLGPAKGGAVRLVAGPGRLIVAEGIETALSFAEQNPEASIWAALSSSGMAGLALPKQAGALIIAADGDAAGRRAADRLADRALDACWRVQILTAPEGEDWNDVLRRRLGDDE